MSEQLTEKRLPGTDVWVIIVVPDTDAAAFQDRNDAEECCGELAEAYAGIRCVPAQMPYGAGTTEVHVYTHPVYGEFDLTDDKHLIALAYLHRQAAEEADDE